MRKWFCLAAVLIMCTVSCLAEGDICVRVGDISYTSAEVRLTIDKQLASYSYYGTEITEELYDAVKEQALSDYVARGIAENKIREYKLDQLDDEIAYAIRESAQNDYEEAWQSLRQQADASVSDETITRIMNEMGMSILSITSDYELGYEISLLLERCGKAHELTDEEVSAFYEEYYIAPMREAYDGNIPQYETDINENGVPALYLPAGYRNIAHILLPIPEEIAEELGEIDETEKQLREECDAIYSETAERALAGEDIEELRTAYAEKQAELTELDVKRGEATARVLPALRTETDEIYARLKTGESFETVQRDFSSTEEAIVFHPDSTMWPDVVLDALLTLENPGDISQPVLYENGVHIFYYESDCESGALSISSAEMQIVRETAQEARDSGALSELVEGWREEYDISVDPSVLSD